MEPEGIGRVAALGPWLLLFPLVFFALGAVWMMQRRSAPPRPPSLPARSAEPVPGWIGRLELEAGALLAQLGPLHADPARQAFDRRTLAERFDLGPGEPWKLILRFGAPEGAESEPEAAAGRWELDLELLAVVGSPGSRLAPLSSAPGEPGSPADPLRVLLAPPPGPLGPGRAVHLVLWGPDPGPGPVLSGLALRGPRPAALSMPLEARPVPRTPWDGLLAQGAGEGPGPAQGQAPEPPRLPRRAPGEELPREAREDRPADDVPAPARGGPGEEADGSWREDER